MRVLLAGGAGFIGSHMADALLSRGDDVVAVDNLCTGRHQNVAHLAHNPSFTLIEHDITIEWPAHPALAESFDAVLDFASPASPNDFATMPLEILAVGSTGTRHLLDRALADRAVFFLTSTSEVYGDPEEHPQRESYWGHVNPIGPRACYDEGAWQERGACCCAARFGDSVLPCRLQGDNPTTQWLHRGCIGL
jgi:dTDP-glucose 4,6-dehydratase